MANNRNLAAATGQVSWFGREPVTWIGIILTFALAIIQTALGQGLISDAIAGQTTDAAKSIASTLVIFLPLILNVIYARPKVTPVAQPSLDLGTPVLIKGTGDTPPPDAMVLPASYTPPGV